MSKEEEYRDYAIATLEMAQRHPESAHRNRLLALAEAWLDLAERAAQTAKEKLQRVYSQNTRHANKDGARPD